jgi:hypothetical protein
MPIMSNHPSAILTAGPAAAAAASPTATRHGRPSLWRRFYRAWLNAYANRIDCNGNVICEH